MSTCKTCVHWSLPSWETNAFGTCALPSARAESKPIKPPVLRALSPGGAFAYVTTHESFGCNHHQPREST